jgi:hypothetical protein
MNPERPKEIALSGGRTTAGVVRIVDTVRRPPKANSAFVRRLLTHLAARGFDSVPRFLGSDCSGREILSFIEGEVPTELRSFSDQALHASAILVRRFHDLGAELVSATDQDGIEVVCHNDLSPCNFVFRNGLPVAMIDFDTASPGTRSYDLGYAVWLWLNIGSPDVPASEQRRRLRLFVDSYGGIAVDVVLRSMMERQTDLIVDGQSQSNPALSDWAAECLEWTQRHASELT